MTNLHVPIMVFVCICVIFLLLVPEKILQNITMTIFVALYACFRSRLFNICSNAVSAV